MQAKEKKIQKHAICDYAAARAAHAKKESEREQKKRICSTQKHTKPKTGR